MNNNRFKFRTPWYLGDRFAGFQYWEFEHGRVKLIGEHWESWVSKRDELTAKPDEQCTGLKDKKRDLIYENDIMLGDSGFKYCIIWSEMELGWVLQNLETRLCITMNAFTPDELEIIGNVHKQADQKDVK